MFKVGQVDAASRLALLRPRLGPPEAVVGEAIREVAKANLRSEFRGQSSETVRSAPFVFCSALVKLLFTRLCRMASQSIRPLCANSGHSPRAANVSNRP